MAVLVASAGALVGALMSCPIEPGDGPAEGPPDSESAILGVPDTTFGSRGWVVHGNAAGGNGDDCANGFTQDGPGPILVCKGSRNAFGDEHLVVWRLG